MSLYSLGFEKVIVTRTCGIPHGDRQNFGKTSQTWSVSRLPGYFEVQFVCDKVVKIIISVQFVVIFLLVHFTAFKLYLYLLKRLFVNRDSLLAMQPCLFIYNEYMFIILWLLVK